VRLTLALNGASRSADIAPHDSLLTALREGFALPGTKNACDQGECGSCSVLLDGELVCSCLVLAAAAEGRDVRTVEGLAPEGDMHPVQRAFMDAGAVQCGFCTPGLIVAVDALLRANPEPTDGEVREALAGNICRCTGYGRIVEAVRRAMRGVGGGQSPPPRP
jgi:carbon-monoxide dehydrogenase small subunit